MPELPGTPTKLYSFDYSAIMFVVKSLPEFSVWLANLKDGTVRGAVTARVKRLSHGLMGDAASVGDGVSELRIHLGAGWRIYYVQHGFTIIVLLCGGSKRSQIKDIQRARQMAATLDFSKEER